MAAGSAGEPRVHTVEGCFDVYGHPVTFTTMGGTGDDDPLVYQFGTALYTAETIYAVAVWLVDHGHINAPPPAAKVGRA